MFEERRSPAHIDLRKLLESHTDAYWIWDMATNTAHWSPSLFQLLSAQPDADRPGLQSLLELIHPDDLSRVRKLIKEQGNVAKPFRIELRFRKKNGEVLWMDCIGETFLDGNEQPTRVVGFHLDITERKSAELLNSNAAAALTLIARGAPEQEVFARLVEAIERHNPAIRASVMLLDDGKQFLHVACAPSLPEFYRQAIDGMEIGPKAATFAAAAYSGVRAIAENISTHPDWRDYRELALRANLVACWSEPIFSPKKQLVGSFALYYHERRAPLAMELKLVQAAAQLAGLAIDRSQSARREKQMTQDLEKKLAKRSAQLRSVNRQLQQLARKVDSNSIARSELLAAASHDLRQPLQSLHAYAASLQNLSEQEECRRIAGKIQRVVNTMVADLDELLSVGKVESGMVSTNVTNMPVQALFDRLLEKYLPMAEQKSLQLRAVKCGGTVRSDPTLLSSILGNLLSNAIRFTNRGSVLLGCQQEAGQLRIDVIDTGIGIAPQDLQRVFDEYYQIDDAAPNEHKGLGLGLAVVKKFAALLDHPLTFSSAQGKGSRFSVTVPYSPAPDAAAADRLNPRFLSGLAVLLVDDDAAVLDATAVLLRAMGANIMAAKSSEEALAKAATCASLDIIVCDFQLPGTHGMQLVKRLRNLLGEEVPALIMTGNIPAAANSALANFRWLQKPVDLDRLISLSQQLVSARSRGEPA